MKIKLVTKLTTLLLVLVLASCKNASKTDSKDLTTKKEVTALDKPNILFIYMDDMGYGDPQCYNPESLIPTPNIDKLAKQGMRFTDAHTAAPICGPSRYGLLTGRYPWRRGPNGHGNGGKFDDVGIESGRLTLASLLKKNGYNTAQLGKWGLSHNYSDAVKPGKKPGTKEAYDFPNKKLSGPQLFGFDYTWTDTHLYPKIGHDTIRGMDPISDSKLVFENSLPLNPSLEVENPYNLLPNSGNKVIEYMEVYVGKKENPKFNQDKSKPFFIYWDSVGPHAPYVPLEQFQGKSKVGRYGDYVYEIDYFIGKMLDKLEELKLADNTIVIFSSDNGPDKYTYERIKDFKHYSLGKWRGVKRDAWEGGNRTPFIVRWPGNVEANTVNNTTFCLTDMMATFAEIVGDTIPENVGEDSFSMLSLLKPTTNEFNRPPIIYHNTKRKMGIRADDWVYMDAPSGAVEEDPEWFKKERGVIPHNQEVELFNLSEDPQQTKNVAIEYPEKVKELKKTLDDMIEKGNSH
ncbi:sulfatase family protein [Polaribacter filamentus]|uniref:sulfatase family protein n=1 Tax=Polaribacter filamentus TaxID=53483 RepID=UPI000CF2D5EA|nr:arylsulfatase [Polaribacter filamentus]